MRVMKPKAYSETHLPRKSVKTLAIMTIYSGTAFAPLIAQEWKGLTMSSRYLPATRVKADGLRLGRLSVRTSDDQEIGKLLGFVIDANAHRISSIVVERQDSSFEVGMAPFQFDSVTRSMRLIQSGDVQGRPFSPDDIPHVNVEDLWVPLFHSAA
jgi:hypothetical protein